MDQAGAEERKYAIACMPVENRAATSWPEQAGMCRFTSMSWGQKTIEELVGTDYLYAAVLHRFGIRYHEHASLSVVEVCDAYGVPIDKVVDRLEELRSERAIAELGEEYPLELVMAYLMHMHHHFIKDRLSYIAGLVREARPCDFTDPCLAADLQFVFPEFTDEFVEHIYEEEDTLFSYLNALLRTERQEGNPGETYLMMTRLTVGGFVLDHINEDEMEGLRELIDQLRPDSNHLCERVLCYELRQFDKDLRHHADIENRLLLPRAAQLEARVAVRLRQLAADN